MQQLTYAWTSVLPHFSQQTNAEVSWQHGVTRIPKQWDLTLQAQDFDLRMPDGSPIHLPVGCEYLLPDIEADTTIRDITAHVTTWLRTRAIQLPDTTTLALVLRASPRTYEVLELEIMLVRTASIAEKAHTSERL